MEEYPAEVLTSLQEQCLVVTTEDNVRPFSPLFGEFVASQTAPDLLEAGPLLIDQRRRNVFLHRELLELTDLLYDLLLCLVRSEGQIISEEVIDQQVWHPDEVEGSKERVKAGIKALRQALGDDKKHIVNQWGKGYAFFAHPPE